MLVGKRLGDYGETLGRKAFFKAHCHVDSVPADFLIKIVGEQSLKLQAEQPAFGENRSVLLHYGMKVRLQLRGKQHRSFSDQGAALCAADIKGVAELGDVFESKVAARGSKGIAKAGTVKVKIKTVFAANVCKFRQLAP